MIALQIRFVDNKQYFVPAVSCPDLILAGINQALVEAITSEAGNGWHKDDDFKPLPGPCSPQDSLN
jgi:hypothetical protein